MRTPRTRHLRYSRYDRVERRRRLIEFLEARADDLATTAADLTFSAAIAQATGVLTLAGNAVAGVKASGVLTLAGNAANTQTVTIGTKVYTFQTSLTNVDGNVLVGANASASIDNLIAAITLGAGSGSTYAAATTAHPTVTASAGAGDTMNVTALLAGTAGNAIATTETLANGSFAAATLTSGTNNETVVIGTRTYTFTSPLINSANNVLIGASASATIDNLIAAINAAAGSGTTYGTGTTAHADVSAAAGTGDTMDLLHLDGGVAGNSIATTETMANGSFAAVTLTGGAESNALNITSHGLSIGDGPFLVDSTTALPEPLTDTQLYWVESVPTVNSITLSTEHGGSVVTITTEGSGTLTMTRPETAEAIFEFLKRNPPEVVRDATDVDDL